MPWLLLFVNACGGEPDHAPDASDAVDAEAPPDAGADAEHEAPPDDSPDRVVTDLGVVRGLADGDAIVFRGIPFAAPPVGPLRWRPPEPAAPWEDERTCFEFGPRCTQIEDGTGAVLGQEDCLTLNVWRPSDGASGLPVLFWIHGGDNLIGASSEPYYDGRILAERGHVVVTINYRLGPFGFLADPALALDSPTGTSGNYGIADQIAALRWVASNIEAFGGDPDRVMVFGQSAGASDTCALVASPEAAGLFSRAAMHSLNCEPLTPAVADATSRAAEEALGCADAPDVAACLRAASTDEVASVPGGGLRNQDQVDYYVTVDGWILPEDPVAAIRAGRHNAMPLIAGDTADEYSALVDLFLDDPYPTDDEYRETLDEWFGPEDAVAVEAQYPVDDYERPRDALVDIISDLYMNCPTRDVVEAAAAGQDEPVWRYVFAYRYPLGPLARYGAAHGFDVEFVFQRWVDSEPDEEMLALSDAMIGYWTRLAATGDPNGDGALPWDRWDPVADGHLVLDTMLGTGRRYRVDACAFWADYYD